MKKLILHIPGVHTGLLLLGPVLLLIMVFTGPHWLLFLAAVAGMGAGLFLSRSWTSAISLQDNSALSRIAAEKGAQDCGKQVRDLILGSLQREEKARRMEEMEKSLQQAREAEKEAKSQMAGLGRDLSSYNFRISELESARKAQEMKITGLRGENELLHKMVRELREEKARLKGVERGKTGT